MIITTTTCNRPDYWRRMMASLPEGGHQFLVSDDGSSEDDLQYYSSLALVIQGKPPGHVGNLNTLWNYAWHDLHADHIFHLEDDWIFKGDCALEAEGQRIMSCDPLILQVVFYHTYPIVCHHFDDRGFAIHLWNRQKWVHNRMNTWPGFQLCPSYINLRLLRRFLPIPDAPFFEYHLASNIARGGFKIAYTPISHFEHIGKVSAYDITGQRR